jgi:hypothetical protein
LGVRGVVVGLFRKNCWIIAIAGGLRGRHGRSARGDSGAGAGYVRCTARVVASHAHVDHMVAARAIVASGAPFLMHCSDVPIAAATSLF